MYRSAVIAVAALLAPSAAWSQIPLGGAFQVNAYTTNRQGDPGVAWDTEGRFVITWSAVHLDGSGDGVFARRFDSAGLPEGSLEFLVNAHTAGNQAKPVVASGADGGFVVAWNSDGQDGSDYGVFARRFDAVPVAQAEFRVNAYTTGFQYGPSLASDGSGAFVVAWLGHGSGGSDWDIHGQRYDASGAALSGPFRVNTYVTGEQRNPHVAADAAGNFVVAWTGRRQDMPAEGVLGQRFDASGQPLDGEFVVNVHTSQAGSSSLAARPGGGFVAVWRSVDEDGSEGGIFARVYDEAGDPSTAPFRVNQFTTGDQREAAASMDADGNFVVVWISTGQDPGSWGVFGRAFNAEGGPVGPEFRVSPVGPAIRRFPAVASAADGRFVVAWGDGDDGSVSGVSARRYQRDLIFRDGFESGSLSAWSAASTDGGDLAPSALAALKFTAAGLRGVVDDTAGLFVQDDTPADENVYIARFYFDPNGFDPGEAQGRFRTRLFIAFEEAPSRRLAAIVLRRIGGQYSVMARARQDDQSQVNSPFVPIADGPHFVEILWLRSTGPDAANGGLLMWIDGVLVATVAGLDNSVSAVDFARLGALSVKAGASGILYWDEFESRRGTLIGP
jgi:hypothetical protein